MSPSMSARLRGLGLVLKVILGLVAMCLSKVLSYVSLSSTVQMCAIYFANFDLPPHYSDTSSLQSASLAGFTDHVQQRLATFFAHHLQSLGKRIRNFTRLFHTGGVSAASLRGELEIRRWAQVRTGKIA